MTVTPTEAAGRLQHLARDFSASLEAGNETAAQEMLAAWSDAYWGTRSELDSLIAYVRKAKAEGQAISPSWLSRERRLKAVLATAKAELEKYAKAGARAATRAQEQALRAAVKQAPALVKAALAEQLPGLAVDLAQVNPALLQNVVGFLGDGTPLAEHMARTVAPDAVDGLRQVLLDGLSKGWSQDRMVREFTKSFAVPHSRAVTIMRTESLRVYRETSRQSYEANRKVVQSWTWQCALDSRSCAGCVMMHGTKHPVEETLDGHPRCRCSMIPNTPTWAELGLPGIEETRVEVPTGEDWFRQQSTGYQRGLLGPGKFDAWKRGELALPDVVARRYDPDWGSMRLERSLKSIRENRNANYGGVNDELGPKPHAAGPAPTPGPIPTPKPPAPPAHPLEAHRLPNGPESLEDALANTNAARYNQGPEWQNNCTNATMAQELRRRGYDVTAAPRATGRDLQSMVDAWGLTPADVRMTTILQMEKGAKLLGEGARGSLTVVWKGRRGAHVIGWEVRGGQLRLLDAQSGVEVTVADYRARISGNVYWWRHDHLPLPVDPSDWLREL